VLFIIDSEILMLLIFVVFSRKRRHWLPSWRCATILVFSIQVGTLMSGQSINIKGFFHFSFQFFLPSTYILSLRQQTVLYLMGPLMSYSKACDAGSFISQLDACLEEEVRKDSRIVW